jgi:hypothetical protein
VVIPSNLQRRRPTILRCNKLPQRPIHQSLMRPALLPHARIHRAFNQHRLRIVRKRLHIPGEHRKRRVPCLLPPHIPTGKRRPRRRNWPSLTIYRQQSRASRHPRQPQKIPPPRPQPHTRLSTTPHHQPECSSLFSNNEVSSWTKHFALLAHCGVEGPAFAFALPIELPLLGLVPSP